MADIIKQRKPRGKSLYRRIERNAYIFDRVSQTNDRGIFTIIAEELGLTRERVRAIFRDEEMRRGKVFHKLVYGKMRRLDKKSRT